MVVNGVCWYRPGEVLLTPMIPARPPARCMDSSAQGASCAQARTTRWTPRDRLLVAGCRQPEGVADGVGVSLGRIGVGCSGTGTGSTQSHHRAGTAPAPAGTGRSRGTGLRARPLRPSRPRPASPGSRSVCLPSAPRSGARRRARATRTAGRPMARVTATASVPPVRPECWTATRPGSRRAGRRRGPARRPGQVSRQCRGRRRCRCRVPRSRPVRRPRTPGPVGVVLAVGPAAVTAAARAAVAGVGFVGRVWRAIEVRLVGAGRRVGLVRGGGDHLRVETVAVDAERVVDRGDQYVPQGDAESGGEPADDDGGIAADLGGDPAAGRAAANAEAGAARPGIVASSASPELLLPGLADRPRSFPTPGGSTGIQPKWLQIAPVANPTQALRGSKSAFRRIRQFRPPRGYVRPVDSIAILRHGPLAWGDAGHARRAEPSQPGRET